MLPHLHCTNSCKRGSQKLYYPTKCMYSPISRSRVSNYYPSHYDTCLCQQYWGLISFSVSILVSSTRDSNFNNPCGGAEKLTKEQLNAARAQNLGASASTMSLADLQAEADHFKVVLPMSCLSFILILKAHIIHWYGYTAGSTLQQAIVTSSHFQLS